MRTLTSAVAYRPVQPILDATSSTLSLRDLILALCHIPLALIMFKSQQIASLQAWLTISLGTYIAVKSTRPEPLVYMCAYAAGCEVLWRITDARAVYHLGKYLTVWIFVIGLLRFRSAKSSLLPLIYFLLLIPSGAVTIWKLSDFKEIKEALSYNLSGALAFAVSAWFLSRVWIYQKDIQRIFFYLIVPIVGIITLTIYSTITAESIRFITESNWVTSAGYNPAMVSDVLGLGALLCFLLFLMNRASGLTLKTLFIAGLVIFTVECVLTFSRQGLYMQIGGTTVALYYLFQSRRMRAKLLLLLGVLLVLFIVIIVPRLDIFTSGKFTQRFADTDPTHRDVLAKDDLSAFIGNPVLGIGPGRSMYFRSVGVYKAHTEYTRVLGEHGIFGLCALILFLTMLYKRWKKMESSKFLMAPLLAWGMLFQFVNATRLAAAALLLGLTFVTILSDEQREQLDQAR